MKLKEIIKPLEEVTKYGYGDPQTFPAHLRTRKKPLSDRVRAAQYKQAEYNAAKRKRAAEKKE